MYPVILDLHSWLRWAVLLAGAAAALRAFSLRRTAGSPAHKHAAGLFFTILLDLQVLLGLILYLFLSPLTRSAMHDMGRAMQIGALRFWSVEHPFGVIVALVLAHLGRARPRHAYVYFTVALLILLAVIPWPGIEYGRPLFRLP